MRKIQTDERAQDGERQRDEHNTGRPGTAEKDEHHRRCEQKTQPSLLHEVADGLPHINRLVHHHIEVDPFDAFEDRLELRFNALDHRDRVRTRLTIDRNVNLPFPVHAHDVRLDLMRVFDLCDVTDVGRRTVANSKRQIIQLRDEGHHAIGVDLIIERAELCVAGRDHDVEIADRIDDI